MKKSFAKPTVNAYYLKSESVIMGSIQGSVGDNLPEVSTSNSIYIPVHPNTTEKPD